MPDSPIHARRQPTPTVALAQFSGSPKQNPYVWRLGQALGEAGVEVLPLPGSALFLFAGPAARRASVIHFQWFEVLIGAPSLAKTLLKSAAFLTQLHACRLLGKRLVWTIHNLQSHEAKYPRVENWVARRMARAVDVMIVHCEQARADAARQFGVPAERIIAIDHGNFIGLYANDIDRESARARLGLGSDDIVFLFFGNIRPYKGLDELVRQFRKLDEPRARLVIAGKPIDDEAARAIRDMCTGDSRIVLDTGFIPDDDVQVYFGACDATVFPYRNILASGAVILAMGFGKACVAPTLGCIPAVLERQSNFLYDATNPKGLAGALESALSRRGELERMGDANLAIAQTLDWSVVAMRTADVYGGFDKIPA